MKHYILTCNFLGGNEITYAGKNNQYVANQAEAVRYTAARAQQRLNKLQAWWPEENWRMVEA